jgi:hypothetical protein
MTIYIVYPLNPPPKDLVSIAPLLLYISRAHIDIKPLLVVLIESLGIASCDATKV